MRYECVEQIKNSNKDNEIADKLRKAEESTARIVKNYNNVILKKDKKMKYEWAE